MRAHHAQITFGGEGSVAYRKQSALSGSPTLGGILVHGGMLQRWDPWAPEAGFSGSGALEGLGADAVVTR